MAPSLIVKFKLFIIFSYLVLIDNTNTFVFVIVVITNLIGSILVARKIIDEKIAKMRQRIFRKSEKNIKEKDDGEER